MYNYTKVEQTRVSLRYKYHVRAYACAVRTTSPTPNDLLPSNRHILTCTMPKKKKADKKDKGKKRKDEEEKEEEKRPFEVPDSTSKELELQIESVHYFATCSTREYRLLFSPFYQG